MNNSRERWKLAQHYEKTWWQNQVEEIDLEFYSRFAREVTEVLKLFISIKSNSYVLEIERRAADVLFVNRDKTTYVLKKRNINLSLPFSYKIKK